MKDTYDVIIIGGEHGGDTAAYYCANAGLETLLIENVYAGSDSCDSAHSCSWEEAATANRYSEKKAKKNAQRCGAHILQAQIYSLDLKDGIKTVFTTKGDIKCKSVILAMGASPRTLGLPGEKALTGKGLSYCAPCDGGYFKGKTVAVIGGGDSAMKDAAALSSICEKIYLIHHKGSFNASPSYIDPVLMASNIVPLYHTVVSGLITSDGIIGGLEVTDKTTGNKGVLNCDGVFVSMGQVPNTKLCKPYVETDVDGYVVAGENTKTNINGVYATGNLRTRPFNQITTASSDGAAAALNAAEYINLRYGRKAKQ